MKTLPQVSVLTTPTQLSATQQPARNVRVQAAFANTESVWIGESDVTSTKGAEIIPGDTQDFGQQDLTKMYAIAAHTGTKVNVYLV